MSWSAPINRQQNPTRCQDKSLSFVHSSREGGDGLSSFAVPKLTTSTLVFDCRSSVSSYTCRTGPSRSIWSGSDRGVTAANGIHSAKVLGDALIPDQKAACTCLPPLPRRRRQCPSRAEQSIPSRVTRRPGTWTASDGEVDRVASERPGQMDGDGCHNAGDIWLVSIWPLKTKSITWRREGGHRGVAWRKGTCSELCEVGNATLPTLRSRLLQVPKQG